MTIGNKMSLSFASILVMMLLMTTIVLIQMNQLNKQFAFVIEHDAPVIANARHMSKLVVDMETGQRGFVITGNESFLDPYNLAKIEFNSLYEIERQLVSDNPHQVRVLDQINKAVTEWDQLAAQPEIALRREVSTHDIDKDILEQMLVDGDGKITLDKIRAIADSLVLIFEHDHNTRALFLLKSIEKSMVDQETGQRGFLITGREEFLEPYEIGKTEFVELIAQLRQLVASAHDRGATEKSIEQLRTLHNAWVAKADIPAIENLAWNSTNNNNNNNNSGSLLTTQEVLRQIHTELDHLLNSFVSSRDERMHALSHTLASSISDQESGLNGYLLTEQDEFLQPFFVGHERWANTLEELRILNSNAFIIKDVSKKLDELETLAMTWLEIAARPEINVRREIDANPHTLATVALELEKGIGKRVLDRTRDLFISFTDEELRLTKVRYAEAQQASKTTVASTLLITLFSILASSYIARRITRGITVPLNELKIRLDLIAQGDRSGEIAIESGDEIGDVAASFNTMVEDLNTLEIAEEQGKIELVKATELAESSNNAKSMFLANMSHEIRTPMTAILGFTDIIKDRAEDEVALDAINTVQRNANFLLSIINDILDLSKIESGNTVVEQIPCKPCSVIAEVMSLIRVRTDEKELQFIVEYSGPMPAEITTDPTRLRQILINLLGNSVKFTDTGSVRLLVQFQPDEDPSSNSGSMIFDIKDTGIGMSETQQRNLFRPFTQADNSTSRKFGGTGLGLTISRQFAQLLGGDLTVVDSRPLAGSLFRACISTGPVDLNKLIKDPMSATLIERTRDAKWDPKSALADTRILVAEDGQDNQRLIRVLLEKAGASVVIVENGKLALDALAKVQHSGPPFDVVLMDMQMPVMDGYTAAAELKKRGSDTPVIALTAHAMHSDRDRCIQAGCDDYLTKPIDRVDLISKCASWASPESKLNRAA
jgi:signal transduction histidine kinase/CheY-like chemotaxis protein